MNCVRQTRHGSLLNILAVLAALALLACVMAGVVIYRAFTAGPEMKSIRQEIFSELGIRCSGRMEVRAPSLLLGLGRVVTSFVDLPDEARMATQAVRGGDVGVYKLQQKLSGAERRQMVELASKALASHEWERVVTVLDGDDTVMIFTPAGDNSPRNFSAFVIVISGHDLVLVQGRADLEPVFELAEREWTKHGRSRLEFN